MAKHCVDIDVGASTLHVKYDPGEYPELHVYYQSVNVKAMLAGLYTANGIPMLVFIRDKCKEICDGNDLG